MTEALARALLALAACCLGQSRSAWALAMQGELEEAIRAGRPLGFALGCLVAAWREMPRHAEGRLILANNALAVGLLVPGAGLQFLSAAAFSPAFAGELTPYAGPVPGSAQFLYLGCAYPAAMPLLVGLWLWIGLLQLRLAWQFLEADWTRLARTGSLIAAATVTLLIFTALLFLDGSRVLVQAAGCIVELAAVSFSARWHGRLYAPARLRHAD